MKKIYLLTLAVLFSLVSFAGDHFTVAYSGNGQDHMNLKVLTATIDGTPLEAGDEIAVFDGTICCGKALLTGSIVFSNVQSYVTIAASKKDEGLPNGFMDGNAITYKIWDSSLSVERTLVSPEYYDSGTGLTTTAPTFTANASAFLKLNSITNSPPVSNAGSDQTINEAATVTLDGSASSDAEANTLTYKWTAPQGITISSTTATKPTFTAPEVTTDTQYTFSLVVNDGTLDSPADQVIVTVKQVNKAPTANAGADKNVKKGTTVTLDGSASSDSDANTLTYKWIAPEGITLSSTTAAKPTFTAPDVTANTPYTFSLVVNDGMVDSPVDQVVITVQINTPTHFTVAYSGNGQDHMNLKILSATIDGTPLEAGDEIGVFDGAICCGKALLTGEIVFSNVQSHVTIAASKKDEGLANGFMDGNAITYKIWDSSQDAERTFVAPEYYDSGTGLITSAPTFTANASAFLKLSSITNFTPVANAGPDQTVNEGTIVILDGSASSDADANKLTYRWTAPADITLSSATATKPIFTAPDVLVDTLYTFNLVVNDGSTDSPSDQVVIMVRNIAPTHFTLAYLGNGQDHMNLKILSATIDGHPLDTGDEIAVFDDTICCGKSLLTRPIDYSDVQSYVTIAASRKDGSLNNGFLNGNVITYRIWDSSEKTEKTFVSPEYYDSSTGLVTTAPTFTANASAFLKLRGITNEAPLANAGKDQNVKKNTIVTLDGSTSTDADANALTYRWTVPASISLSSTTTAMPTFTAPDVTANTQYTFSLVVNDGIVDSPADQVIVSVKLLNAVPVSNAGPDQTVDEGASVSLNGFGSLDPDNDALNYSWTAPLGITLSSITAAKPTFTAPEVATDTHYTFTLAVNDGIDNANVDQVIITVKQVNKAPSYITAKQIQVNEDESFEFILEGYDIDHDSIVFAFSNLPNNLNLSTISRTKAVLTGVFANEQVGLHKYFLILNDGILTYNDTITIVVMNVDDAPYLKDSLRDIAVQIGTMRQLNLNSFFGDIDATDVLVYSVYSNSNDSVVTVSIVDSILLLNFSKVNTGTSEIVISASSNEKIITCKFRVEVTLIDNLHSLKTNPDIQIYPNPTKNFVNIRFKQNTDKGTSIVIYDTNGKLKAKQSAEGENVQIDLHGFLAGVYIIQINQEKTTYYRLLIE